MMADDPDRDLIPIKDVKGSHISQSLAQTESSEVPACEKSLLVEKKIAEQISRSDLEDQLFRLKDENLELKKTSWKQEDQIKKLATKMSRLLSEKKKREVNSSPGHKRDIEMEELVEDLHDKVRMLEKSNISLREKLLVAKQQVITQSRRPSPYNHIPPKVNSGRPKSGISPYTISSNMRGISAHNTQRRNAPSTPLPPYVMQLLDEARNELFNLKEVVSTQKNEIDMYEQEVEILKERLRMKDVEFNEEINLLKSQITEGQRQHVQENLDLIRLHRELKQKNSKIISLQAQVADAEERMKAQKMAQDRLAKEVEEKTMHMREEQKKSLDLFAELQKNKASLLNLADLQESLKALKRENDILKETNEKLINSVLNQDRDRSSQSVEHSLKEQIFQIESSLRTELKGKEHLEEEIRAEKEKYRQLNEEYTNLKNNFAKVKEHLSELESKVDILKSEEVDFQELGEALALIKLKKQQSIKIDFLENVSDETEEDLKSRLRKSEKDHADTLKELCNVREMLMTQYKLNKDAQEEIRLLTEKFAQQEKEFKIKSEEYANLLDIRAARIQKLERQLNDIAYGTKKFKIKDYEDDADIIETLDLHRGENLFEIHVIKFVYSNDGLKALKNNNPSTFFTWNFYEFELQSTPVAKGNKPQFSYTSQYKVKVDDFFLLYMHKNSTIFELHESLGIDYRTLAACHINFSEVLEQPHGRLHGTQELISVCESATGVNFGTLHYWVRFKVPMEEAFKLYKEKFKALKYIQSNKMTSNSAVKILNQPSTKDSAINDLHIKILRCVNLQGRYKDVQPSPFCVYKFYDLPEQDTMIVPASNNPEFSAHHTFPLYMDVDLEKYLKTQNLDVYVFDDNDPDSSSYIGLASISLLSLSQGKHIKGSFELTKDGKGTGGLIEMSLYWQNPYKSSSGTITLPEHMEKPIEYPLHLAPAVSVINGLNSISSGKEEKEKPKEEEEEEFDYSVKVVPVPKPRKRAHFPKPVVTSTPIKTAPLSSSSSSVSLTEQETAETKSLPQRDSNEAESTKSIPRPAVRQSKLKLSSVDDLISYGESLLKSPVRESSSAPGLKETLKGQSNEAKPKLFDKSELYDDDDDEDTVFQKKQEISFEEISDEDDKQVLSESELTSSESEADVKIGVPVSSSDAQSYVIAQSHVIPSITIGIWHLSLKPNSSVLNDSRIQMLYVEYIFLDYPLEEMETPYSLPKPIPPDVITFGYKKVFPFDPRENHDKYNLLSRMFNRDTPEASWIKFTVVSEPPSDEEHMDCEDVGYAYVDLQEILHREKDVVEQDIIIYDAKDSEDEIGQLNVTVEILAVLRLL